VFRHPIVRSKLGFPSLNASQKLLEKYRWFPVLWNDLFNAVLYFSGV
jgi:hypothetical protein